ncbi:MAG TPA: carboxypeptidase-like regulatory domain-containing protein, partial [Salinivirgaceae bacterium]|nr:carboxypeptidase-like regulatory domain-containing protein [Salinivirgaceae bacterium]
MRFSLFVILFFFPFFTYAQLTKVRGKVIDAATKEPLAFVSIAFQGTTIGVISDIDGNYHIETRTTSDTLIFSYVGYSKEVRKIKRAQFQEIDVELTASTISLQEIV